MTYLEGIILGAVQGLTEFLPISSSAHLAFVQNWLRLNPDELPMEVFDGVSHVGTVLAVFVVFFAEFRGYFARLLAELSPGWTRHRYALHIAWLGICASVPTAFIGLAFKKHFEKSFGDPVEVGGGLIFSGLLLLGTLWLPRGRKGWKRFAWWHAALVGVAQGVSISPGISRSGATICTAEACGIRRRWAAQFSFFIAIPAILGATLLKLREAFGEHVGAAATIAWGPTLVGAVVAFLLGVGSLIVLLDAVRRARLHYFAWYCFVVGALIMSKVLW